MSLPPSLDDVFSAWADWRVLQRRPPKTPTLVLYRQFWEAWCCHLAGRNAKWSDALPVDLVAYLTADKRDVTQARYKRLLSEIYAFAAVQGWVPANPAGSDLPEVASRERPVSTAMHLDARDRFIEALVQAARSPVQQRDAAFLLLLAVEGLTVSEALALRLADLELSASSPQVLRVDGKRKAQARRLELDPRTANALRCWLVTAAPHMPAAPEQQPLLPNVRSRMSWTEVNTRHGWFRIVRAALAQAVELGHLDTAPAEHGPQLLRNTALLAWLEQGVSPAEVQRRAGLQRLDGLDRIVTTHGFGSVLERFKAQRRAERSAALTQGQA